MKIAILHPILDPVGGAELIVAQLGEALLKRGHEVTIFTGYYARDRWRGRIPEGLAVKELFHSRSDNGEDIRPLDWMEAGRMLAVELNDYDIVNPHNFPTVLWTCFAKKLSKRFPPTVWLCEEPLRVLYRHTLDGQGTMHRPLSEIINDWKNLTREEKYRETANRIRTPKEIFARYMDRLAVRSLDLVLANSEFTRESIRKVYGVRAEVCYLGVPFNKEEKTNGRPECGEDFILSVSRLVPLKNFRGVIRAFAILKEKLNGELPGLKLKIVGTGFPEMDDLKIFTESLRLEGSVEFLGFVPDEELQELYTRARLMMMLPYEEPFGLIYIEAMRRGLPVIGPSQGGPAEIIQDGISGILVDPDDPEAAAGSCAKVLTMPQMAKELAQGGRKRVMARFTFDRFVDRFEEAVTPLLKK